MAAVAISQYYRALLASCSHREKYKYNVWDIFTKFGVWTDIDKYDFRQNAKNIANENGIFHGGGLPSFWVLSTFQLLNKFIAYIDFGPILLIRMVRD